eukprot:TRINITY_DN12730_c5_g1_i1.p1 TRINITY_DN12730_c5_g1~~TRINITY_DN12730_c5_g1_i1.p1  ORF type:complete len:176 (+),score=1.09 TRINITY_DN12730_c5_g1_i1:248-775(+)
MLVFGVYSLRPPLLCPHRFRVSAEWRQHQSSVRPPPNTTPQHACAEQADHANPSVPSGRYAPLLMLQTHISAIPLPRAALEACRRGQGGGAAGLCGQSWYSEAEWRQAAGPVLLLQKCHLSQHDSRGEGCVTQNTLACGCRWQKGMCVVTLNAPPPLVLTLDNQTPRPLPLVLCA